MAYFLDDDCRNVRRPSPADLLSGDALRRAADAMRLSGSRAFILTRVALEAAICSEQDVLELLDAQTKRTPPKPVAELALA
jgi:hypothetical protein